MDNNQIHTLNVISHIKKYIKKHPVTGVVERENWFQFKYRVTGVTFLDDRYSWNRRVKINVEVSDKYWILNSTSGTFGWAYSKYYMWSARRRNQYIRTYVREEIKQVIELFSVDARIEIGTIKVVQK
jgi:hypothetical protein